MDVLSQAVKGHIPPHNGASVCVCVAGAAGMNVTPERISEARQPLINVNRMKGSYQRRQRQTLSKPSQPTVHKHACLQG